MRARVKLTPTLNPHPNTNPKPHPKPSEVDVVHTGPGVTGGMASRVCAECQRRRRQACEGGSFGFKSLEKRTRGRDVIIYINGSIRKYVTFEFKNDFKKGEVTLASIF